jgi:hypothetical protein
VADYDWLVVTAVGLALAAPVLVEPDEPLDVEVVFVPLDVVAVPVDVVAVPIEVVAVWVTPAVACLEDRVRAGSWPAAIWTPITTQTATKTATVSATTRVRRARLRTARRRGRGSGPGDSG